MALCLHLPHDYPMVDLADRLGDLGRALGGYWAYRGGVYHVYANIGQARRALGVWSETYPSEEIAR